MECNYNTFLERYYHEDIIEALHNGNQTLVIDFHHIENFDLDASDRLLSSPDQELAKLTTALHDYSLPADVDSDLEQLRVSIKNLPDTAKLPVHKIGSDLVSHLTAVEGRINKIGPKQSKLLEGAFKCQRCTQITYVHQPDNEDYVEPFECESDTCGRKGPFKLVEEESKRTDEQKLVLQNLYEHLNPGQPVSQILVYVRGDIIESIPALGAQVIITGIVRVSQPKGKNISNFTLEANYIETKDADIDITLTEADKKELRELKDKGNIFNNLEKSICTAVLGYSEIKQALLAALVSGPNHIKDGTHYRGYLNVLLCGDPGTAKTVMGKSIKPLSPRTQYAAGRGSSSVGLTVSVVKDELSGNGWTTQAGALVLADKGLMILDEMDKQSDDDIKDLNTALEHNNIEIHKVGINQTFSCRCPIIGILNPKNARFNDSDPYTKQVKIPADTLSRFDLIFLIRDLPNTEKDKKIAIHLGAIWQQLGSDQVSKDSDIIPLETLCKYIAYAKTFSPRIPDEVIQDINNYYLSLRNRDENSDTITATARDYNAICRLTISLTKLRLSNDCSIEDVERAIAIHKASQEIIRDPTTGKTDTDLLYDCGQSQRDRIKTVKETILDLQGTNGGKAFFNDILSSLIVKGISKEHVIDILHHLKKSGDLIEPSNNFFMVIV